MERWRKIAIRTGLGLVALAAAVLIFAFLLLRTGPGQSLLSAAIAEFSDRHIVVQGLSGALPDDLHAESVEVADAHGVWLRAYHVTLDWRALAALDNRFVIRNVSATRVVLLRLPHSEEKSSGATPQIDIGSLSLLRIEVAEGVAGRAAILSARGSLRYVSADRVSADVVVARLDNHDRYAIKGAVDNDVANGTLAISEGDGGLLGALVGLPALGPIHLDAQAQGNARANVLAFRLTAGRLAASGNGTISLQTRALDLNVQAHAPAMQPAPDVAWQSLALNGHVSGSFDAPDADATLAITGADARGVSVGQLSAKISGNDGAVDLAARAESVRIPGSRPDTFAAAPVLLVAHADLRAPHRPIHFSLTHPLVQVSGDATTSDTRTLAAKLALPSLQAVAGDDLQGSATFSVSAAEQGEKTALAIDGHLGFVGTAPPARLLGQDARLVLKADFEGNDITASQISLNGKAVALQARGSFKTKSLAYTLDARLSDLSRLSSTLKGETTFTATVSGALDRAEAKVQGSALVASQGYSPQRVTYSLHAAGLPDLRLVHIDAGGRFDDAPVMLKADYTTSPGKPGHATLVARWKSLTADARMLVERTSPASGTAHVTVGKLNDFSSLAGTKLAGHVDANLGLTRQDAHNVLRVDARIKALAIENARADTATVNGTITDPFGKSSFALAVDAHDLSAEGVSGDAQANLSGPLDKLAVGLKSVLKDSSGAPATIAGTALVDGGKRRAVLSAANAQWRGETFALKAPATLDFAKGISVDRLVANLGGGTLTLEGSVSPKLAATVSIANLPAQSLSPFMSGVPLAGTLSLDARLAGTTASPTGTITLKGSALRAGAYSTKAVAPADLTASGLLDGKFARIVAQFAAGASARAVVSGEAPLAHGAPLDLHAVGSLDLALLNPVLMADARQAKGKVDADLHVTGVLASPRVAGRMTLANGEVQDFARGVRLHDIAANLQAEGSQLRITNLSAAAGSGTITGNGTIDVGAPGMPVAITLTAKNARPVASDRVAATLSGELKLTGKLNAAMALAGRVDILRGDINLPESFPPDVAVLNVRKRGEAPPPPPSESAVSLDLTVSVPGQIFVRGHGVDANFGGRIHISGTSGTPLVSGGFTMNRGSLSVAGQTLDFTSGKVSFDGTGVRRRLDPTLDLVAQSTSNGVTATLTVTGYASAPKITLTSSPDLPQDEILAHLLFQQSTKQLTPLQLAGIAQAIAELGGVGNGFDPLGTVRKSLGLDRLAVGSMTGTQPGQTQTTVEAGKYVLRNVYLGTKQSLSGGTQVQVQVDLTRSLKAQGTLSTMNSPPVVNGNALQDNGSSVGLSYQIEY